MSIQAVAWAINQRVGSPTGKALLFCLANYADEDGKCWPSQSTIAAEAELGATSTRHWLKKLEESGLIVRKARHRKDGSRTSDIIELQLTKSQKSGPSDSEGGGSTSRGSIPRQVPGNEPVIEPPIESSSLPSSNNTEAEERFYCLLNKWPDSERPKSTFAAISIFRRLPLSDQLCAIEFADSYRLNAKAQGHIGYLIPYIKQTLFNDFRDGPKLSLEGFFRIEPKCVEWSLWLTHIKVSVSEAARDRTARQGFLLTKTRFPPAASTSGKPSR